VDDIPAVRHPLGLPAGSVRALLAMMIAAQFWTLLLIPEDKGFIIPLFLYFLTAVVLLFFFAHGKSISTDANQRPPFGLPRGTFRGLIILGTAAVFGYYVYRYNQSPLPRLVPKPEQLGQWPGLLIALAAGLGGGWLVGRGPWRKSMMFQDFQAWLSLLAMMGLVIETIFVLLINPNLRQEHKVDLTLWECILTGVISWYFGARS
jgi:hypothetical protein